MLLAVLVLESDTLTHLKVCAGEDALDEGSELISLQEVSVGVCAGDLEAVGGLQLRGVEQLDGHVELLGVGQ